MNNDEINVTSELPQETPVTVQVSPQVTNVNLNERRPKWIFFSSIFMSALVLLIIGIEPYVPQLTEYLPDSLKQVASIILPIVIMLARQYKVNNPTTLIIPSKDN